MTTNFSQEQQVLDLLSSPNPNGLTRMQIAKCLGYDRASICFRVRDLQKRGLIWVVKKGPCPVTKNNSEFLTANRDVARSIPKGAKTTIVDKELTGKLF